MLHLNAENLTIEKREILKLSRTNALFTTDCADSIWIKAKPQEHGDTLNSHPSSLNFHLQSVPQSERSVAKLSGIGMLHLNAENLKIEKRETLKS